MQILGITGGMATGKSAVTQMLADLGAPTISADALAHRLLAPGTAATQAVLAAFPDCADPADPQRLTIDRRALGQRIFGDPNARAHLESLTHPAIIAALKEQFARWRSLSEPRAGAAEIPLLFETHLAPLVDGVVVVACAEEVQMRRLQRRLGLDKPALRQMLAAQMPLAEKIARADFVVTTDGSLDETRRQVAALWNESRMSQVQLSHD